MLVPSRARGGLRGRRPGPALRPAALVRPPLAVSFPGPWGPLTSYHPLAETTIGPFPSKHNPPFFILSAEAGDFCDIQPCSSCLWREVFARKRRQAGWLAFPGLAVPGPSSGTVSRAGPAEPSPLFVPSTTSDSLWPLLMCASPTPVHSSVHPVLLAPSPCPWLFVHRGEGKQ